MVALAGVLLMYMSMSLQTVRAALRFRGQVAVYSEIASLDVNTIRTSFAHQRNTFPASGGYCTRSVQ